MLLFKQEPHLKLLSFNTYRRIYLRMNSHISHWDSKDEVKLLPGLCSVFLIKLCSSADVGLGVCDRDGVSCVSSDRGPPARVWTRRAGGARRCSAWSPPASVPVCWDASHTRRWLCARRWAGRSGSALGGTGRTPRPGWGDERNTPAWPDPAQTHRVHHSQNFSKSGPTDFITEQIH